MASKRKVDKVSVNEKKILPSLDSMLKRMEVTEEEKKYKEENFGKSDLLKDHRKHLVCTRCNLDFLKTIRSGGPVNAHPLLRVLMCDSCCDYYGDGNFSVDSEGEDKYCRWCGDGGTIFVCSECSCGFCDMCIKKHFEEKGLEEVKNNDNWICYFCNPKPLWYLRCLCSLAEEEAKNITEHLTKKESRSLKKKKRKKVVCGGGGGDKIYESNNDSTAFKNGKQRPQRHVEKLAKVGSSSSDEDIREKFTTSPKKAAKSERQSSNEETKDQLSDTILQNPKKKLKTSSDAFDRKKPLVLEKLKSIWNLTQSVMEVGLNSSREKVKQLSKSWNFNSEESLKREHKQLKYCLSVLATSINSASNAVNAIKDDLNLDTAKNETEIIREQEKKLKTLAKIFQKQSHSETSADSDGSTSQNELPEKETAGDGEEVGRKEGGRDTKKKSDHSSEEEEDERGKHVSGSGSDTRDAEKDDGNRNEERDSGKEGGPVKPMLKVKSFARMLNDNVYDNGKEKTPVVVDLYDVETDESENEKQTNKGGKKRRKELASKDANSSHDEKTNKSKSEQENGEKDRNYEKPEKKGRRKKKTVENEQSKESKEDTSTKEDKSETASEDEDRPENKSSGEKDGKKEEEKKEKKSSDEEDGKQREGKKEKNSSDDRESGEEEEVKTRKTRNPKTKIDLKASFENFKRKRERYLRLTKESKNNKEKIKKTKVLESSESESDNEKKEKHRNRRPKKKRVLTSSDEENEGKAKETKSSDEEEEEAKKNQEESDEGSEKVKNGEEGSEKENQNGNSDEAQTSESSSEQEFDTRKRKRIRKRRKGSSDSGEDGERAKRKKTKRGSSDSSGDEESKKGKKGRKNIKKILKKDSLKVETQEALKNEEERKKRLKEKQKLFEELFPEEVKEEKSRQLILDFDPETKEPLVTIHKKLAKKLKPHQIRGVKFMWDNCFESVQRLEEEGGSGCILAHCMGLGKTLQVVTLVHTVMTHDLGVNSVLIVCPLSTVSNWIREFETWLENIHTDPITLYDLVKYKKAEERQMHLEDWHKNGGVLVISYDLFRNLTKSLTNQQKQRKKKSKRIQAAFGNALLDPGPDLVVCDEGHLLKNEDTALSKCMSGVKTARRIVLTGTPLQNNLMEYHCMVQFVKPNILGTRKEFCNRFVNPINNGQFEDSTELDVKIMKRRSHVLHSMLEGCIQRFDYSVLTPFLPEKHEYVLQIALTETQAKAYLHFIKNHSAKSTGTSRATSLFNDYQNLHRIWTHPRTLLMQKERENQKEALASDSEGSLKDFVVSSDEETSEPESDSSADTKPMVTEPRKRVLRSNANDPEVRKAIEEEESMQNRNWWDTFYDEKSYDDMRESNKLVLLFALLKYCSEMKDKVLVFSQSLYSLDLIEYFLAKVDENNQKNNETLCGHQGTWILGSDYFRLDGTTSSETRAIWCKNFNKESNSRGRLFLISTRAGGLGINLYGANRVIIFDASWNPSHDLQSIFRVYRFGQKKPCYIYRFLAEATMEEKIYERQVAKLSLAHRVVDEHQIERHYTMGNLQELYTFEPTPKDQRKVPNLPKDSVLADLLANHKDVIVGYHEHDSLLENKEEEELSEEERKAAWKEYEEEKVQRTHYANVAVQHDVLLLQQQMQQHFLMMQQQRQEEVPISYINPAHLGHLKMGPNVITPVSAQSNIPVEVLIRGLRVGMTPLPKETLESFTQRIINRESWLTSGGSVAEVIE